jgi:hypothetical protein
MSIIEFITNNISNFLALAGTGVFEDVLAGFLDAGGHIAIVPVLFF